MKRLTALLGALLNVGNMYRESIVKPRTLVAAAGLALVTVFPSLLHATTIGSTTAGFASQRNNSLPAEINNERIRLLNDFGSSIGFDNHGIVEFDISSLSSPVSGATLELFRNRESSASSPNVPFTIDVFAFIGDGILSQADFGVGTLIGGFTYMNQSSVLFDVTTFVNSLVGSANFVGLDLRKQNPDFVADIRFDGRVESSPPSPQISASAPEPATLVIIGLCLANIGYRRRKAKRRKTHSLSSHRRPRSRSA